MKNKTDKTPRPESERAAAVRLENALGHRIHRSTVRRLRARGIDLLDPQAVKRALGNQERISGPIQPKPNQSPPRPSETPQPGIPAGPSRPLTSAELDERLAALESDLLNAADYQEGRSIRIKISGYRELVRIQKERGHLVDREQVQGEAYQFAAMARTALLQLPGKLIPSLTGLDFPEAHQRAEDFVFALLTELHETAKSHVIPLPETFLSNTTHKVE